ncbi:uncharacterized protein CELE_W04H10.1 [Caenorhabditis elegans]|uniref:Uncharacterized protein n=1 Tax=Caenorhabditis elegans TaxID=6239 RepID=O44852_CAEEL|nr:Uncharacterized protein CELE_W04H10.1 [Caenorhabditis elegans]CCD73634.1 Uncharacterized protein CELE_W04H10.1 [Caenorhabditis elegans]|eukprot:NP_493770.1 Uncharacterized protein CELE_W04H10.1 [Caenorhabditis elegans]
MSLLVQFDEFKGHSHEQFMEELDTIMLVSINKLHDNMDLRRRLLIYSVFGKVFQHRKMGILAPHGQEETF